MALLRTGKIVYKGYAKQYYKIKYPIDFCYNGQHNFVSLLIKAPCGKNFFL